MTASIFEISTRTSSGVVTVNLLDFHPLGWNQNLPDWKAGGTWSSSPFANGELLTSRVFAGTNDVFLFNPQESDQDWLIDRLRELVALLEKSVAFGTTPWQNEPVWIKVRGACETNAMYALIRGYKIPQMDDPTFEPFAKGLIEGWTLALVHDIWQDCEPQTDICVQTSSMQTALGAPDGDDYWPLTTGDNVTYYTTGDLVSTKTGYTVDGGFGTLANGRKRAMAINFHHIRIPRGSHIDLASIVLQNLFLQVGVNVVINITAERGVPPDTPLVGHTYFEMVYERPRLTTVVTETIIIPWVNATDYTIAGLAALIQEVIDQPGWTGIDGDNDITLYFEDAGSDIGAFREVDWNVMGSTHFPKLTLTFTPSDDIRGRSATCLDEVIIADKQHKTQISYMYYYDSTNGHYHDNILARAWAPLPFPTLLSSGHIGAEVAAGDYWEFGSAAGEGPFHNIVLDIQIASNIPLTLELWFYDGVTAAWREFEDFTWTDGTEGLSLSGVRIIQWSAPGTIGYLPVGAFWTQNNAGPAGAFFGFWVQLRVAAIPAATNDIYIWNRKPYTCCWAFGEIEEGQIFGDLPALARTQFHALCHNQLPSYFDYDSFYLATRSVHRGVDFSPYINLYEGCLQNPIGITIRNELVHGTTTTKADNASMPWGSPCGVVASFEPVGAAIMDPRLEISLDYSVSKQYIGKYAMYVRYSKIAGPGSFTLRVEGTFGLGSFITDTIVVNDNRGVALIDYIDIGGNLAPNEYTDLCKLDVCLAATDAGELVLYDLILVPIDEFSIFVARGLWNLDSHSGWGVPEGTDKIIIDSTNYRKVGARVYQYRSPPDIPAVMRKVEFYMSGEWRFQADTHQKIWYFGIQGNPFLVGSMQNFANLQYLFSRGAK